jgi:hypothetical protein
VPPRPADNWIATTVRASPRPERRARLHGAPAQATQQPRRRRLLIEAVADDRATALLLPPTRRRPDRGLRGARDRRDAHRADGKRTLPLPRRLSTLPSGVGRQRRSEGQRTRRRSEHVALLEPDRRSSEGPSSRTLRWRQRLARLLDAYSGHGGVATPLRGEGQSDPECRNGGSVKAERAAARSHRALVVTLWEGSIRSSGLASVALCGCSVDRSCSTTSRTCRSGFTAEPQVAQSAADRPAGVRERPPATHPPPGCGRRRVPRAAREWRALDAAGPVVPSGASTAFARPLRGPASPGFHPFRAHVRRDSHAHVEHAAAVAGAPDGVEVGLDCLGDGFEQQREAQH